MPADWLDDVVRATGEVVEDLEVTIPVTLHHKTGKDDRVTGGPITEPTNLNVTMEGPEGERVVYQRVESYSQLKIRIFDPTVVVSKGDFFTWGDSPVRHYVKAVSGLRRDTDGSRYGAVCIVE